MSLNFMAIKKSKSANKNIKLAKSKSTKTKLVEKNKKSKNSKETVKPSNVKSKANKKAEKIEKKAAKENKSSKSKVAIIEKKELPKNTSTKKFSETKSKFSFKIGDYAIYPSHGVGKIIDIEKSIIMGQEFNCYLMLFEKEKLTIKIPTNSAEKIGLRHLVSKSQMEEVFSTLRSGIKKLKGMWSRRAQEYETKINSGDIMLLAEVLRDLTRDIEDGDRSYSERIIYETAVNRLAAEYAVVYGIEFEEAKEKVTTTAKDKLGIEGKVSQKDEFDEFDYDVEDSERDEEEEEEDEDEEEDDDEEMYDDEEDEDERPRRRKSRG